MGGPVGHYRIVVSQSSERFLRTNPRIVTHRAPLNSSRRYSRQHIARVICGKRLAPMIQIHLPSFLETSSGNGLCLPTITVSVLRPAVVPPTGTAGLADPPRVVGYAFVARNTRGRVQRRKKRNR